MYSYHPRKAGAGSPGDQVDERSLLRETQGGQDTPYTLGLFSEVRSKFISAHVVVTPAAGGQNFLPRIRSHNLFDGCIDRSLLLRRDILASEERAPVDQLNIHALGLQWLCIDALDGLRIGDSQCAQVARLDLSLPFAITG